MSRCVLAVLQHDGIGAAGLQVLVYFSAERSHNRLQAAADAEDRQVAVVSQTYGHQLHVIALGIHTSELRHRLFAEEKGIQVCATRDEQAVDTVKEAAKLRTVFRRRYNERQSACTFYATEVPVGQFAAFVSIISYDTDDGMGFVVGVAADQFFVGLIYVKVFHSYLLSTRIYNIV